MDPDTTWTRSLCLSANRSTSSRRYLPTSLDSHAYNQKSYSTSYAPSWIKSKKRPGEKSIQTKTPLSIPCPFLLESHQCRRPTDMAGLTLGPKLSRVALPLRKTAEGSADYFRMDHSPATSGIRCLGIFVERQKQRQTSKCPR